MAGNLDAIDHIVLLMLENRSFDHMLGYLYAGQNNRSPLGHPFEGLTGNESNVDSNGTPVPVFPITAATPNAYRMPGVNPGESYIRRTTQLFNTTVKNIPTKPPAPDKCNIGYVIDFEARVKAAKAASATAAKKQYFDPDTQPSAIMGCFSPEMLPVLSGLARGYAVCDHWFSSVPSETMPNRAFALAGTSLGTVDDSFVEPPTYPTYNTPSIFGRLADAGKQWRIYACGTDLTKDNFPDTYGDDQLWRCQKITDFKNAARNGTLPEFCLIEPAWGSTGQNDQHPVSDVSAGEQLISDVYDALRNGPDWNSTLLIVTYDEPGGCYDHVAPPWGPNVVAPDGKRDPKTKFAFNRLGPRVPAVLVSPLIRAGTVFRVPDDGAPLEHTAILKLIETRWGLKSLSARDEAAPDLSPVLTLSTPRTDDPLAGVQVPHDDGPNPSASDVTGLQELQADNLEAHPNLKNSDVVKETRPTDGVEFDNYLRTLNKHSRTAPAAPAPRHGKRKRVN